MNMTLTKTQEQIFNGNAPITVNPGGRIPGRTFQCACRVIAEAMKSYPEPLNMVWLGKNPQQVMEYLCAIGFVVRMENGIIEGAVTCKALDEDLPFRIKVI